MQIGFLPAVFGGACSKREVQRTNASARLNHIHTNMGGNNEFGTIDYSYYKTHFTDILLALLD